MIFAWSTGCQIVSGIAAAAGVLTGNHVVSRLCRGTALATIAGDYALKSVLYRGEAAYLLGFVTYAIPTLRTLSIAAVPRLDRERSWRIAVCGAAFVAQLALWVAVVSRNRFEFVLVLPLIGFGLASAADMSNHMSIRRHFILVIGLVMAIFAIHTEAWGLLVKALIADAGASIYALAREFFLATRGIHGDRPRSPIQQE